MSYESRLLCRLGLVAILAILGAALGPARATEPGGAFTNICDHAAATVARETTVPLPVLLAITRTETGRNNTPWPWTVNMEGTGHWFDSRAEAERFALARQAGGAESFDIGCFQINHRWHGMHFSSISEMFEPTTNARYAAQFLTSLYTELGSWDAAVGAYHSRTPRYATRYLRIYHGHLADLNVAPDLTAQAEFEPEAAPRTNSFPLLQAGASLAGAGSLVPLSAAAAQPLFGPRP